MLVFKFGGASISSLERFRAVAAILERYRGEKILLVVSAMGKTTNALEKVTEAFYDGRMDEALHLFEGIKQQHLQLSKYLVSIRWQEVENKLKDFFTEVEWLLHDKPVRSYDYYYDQVVCIGEMMSSTLLSVFLNEEKIENSWVDVRDIIRTDNNFRKATVDWAETEDNITGQVKPLFEDCDIIITQGFIGATDENESTTLGREGSDFSAAIFANLLPASEVVIWKDVDAVMNADPSKFPDAVNMPLLSYAEVIEMAYYGAQVIHPKTIKPLQNKNIPLHVKSFLNPTAPGTRISGERVKVLPPVLVIKNNQVLIRFSSLDFSFVSGPPVEFLQDIMEDLHIDSSLRQHTAISLLCCFDDTPKLHLLAEKASELFDVEILKGLRLITIRHYTDAEIEKFTAGKNIILSQKTVDTAQYLVVED